jgi:hypothetical protein
MKKILCTMFAVALVAISAQAVTMTGFYTVGSKAVNSTTAVRLVSGVVGYGRLSIANPTTSYAVFDVFQTTATPGTTRLPIKTLCVPAGTSPDFDFTITGVRDFSIALSTTSIAAPNDYKVYYEYKTN